jgi:hypothetical protein
MVWRLLLQTLVPQEASPEEKPRVPRMHSVQDSEMTHIYLYSTCIHSARPRGAGHNTVTKMAVVHMNTAHQKLDHISCSLSEYRGCLIDFSITVPNLS